MAMLDSCTRSCQNVDDISRQSKDNEEPIDLSCHNRNTSTKRNSVSEPHVLLTPSKVRKQEKINANNTSSDEGSSSHGEVYNQKRSKSAGCWDRVHQEKKFAYFTSFCKGQVKTEGQCNENSAVALPCQSSIVRSPANRSSRDFFENTPCFKLSASEYSRSLPTIVPGLKKIQSNASISQEPFGNTGRIFNGEKDLSSLYTQLRSNLGKEMTNSSASLASSYSANVALMNLLTSSQTSSSNDQKRSGSSKPETEFPAGTSFQQLSPKSLQTPFSSPHFNPSFLTKLASRLDPYRRELLNNMSNYSYQSGSALTTNKENSKRSFHENHQVTGSEDQQRHKVPNMFPKFPKAMNSEYQANVLLQPSTSNSIKKTNKQLETLKPIVKQEQNHGEEKSEKVIPQGAEYHRKLIQNKFLGVTESVHPRPIKFKPCKIVCQLCGRTYATEGSLSKHMKMHENPDFDNTFNCKICRKTCSTLGALRMHIRTHTLPCECHICGKAFSRTWLLQGHIRTHTGEKPYQCPKCSRAFADRSNLRAHMQTHEAIKRYSCQGCDKTFSRISLLKRHQRHCSLPILKQTSKNFADLQKNDISSD